MGVRAWMRAWWRLGGNPDFAGADMRVFDVVMVGVGAAGFATGEVAAIVAASAVLLLRMVWLRARVRSTEPKGRPL